MPQSDLDTRIAAADARNEGCIRYGNSTAAGWLVWLEQEATSPKLLHPNHMEYVLTAMLQMSRQLVEFEHAS